MKEEMQKKKEYELEKNIEESGKEDDEMNKDNTGKDENSISWLI